VQSNEEGLVLISEALKAAGCEGKVKIAMDCAASEFYSECCCWRTAGLYSAPLERRALLPAALPILLPAALRCLCLAPVRTSSLGASAAPGP
jgi:hypothetical protein